MLILHVTVRLVTPTRKRPSHTAVQDRVQHHFVRHQRAGNYGDGFETVGIYTQLGNRGTAFAGPGSCSAALPGRGLDGAGSFGEYARRLPCRSDGAGPLARGAR